jgi:hypothetical protein
MSKATEIRLDQIYGLKVLDDNGLVEFRLNDVQENEVVVTCAYNDLTSLISMLGSLYQQGHDRAKAKPKN